MTSARPLENLVANWTAAHDLATMDRRIEGRQLLRERELGLTNRSDQNVQVLSGHLDRLPDPESSGPRHSRRNSRGLSNPSTATSTMAASTDCGT